MILILCSKNGDGRLFGREADSEDRPGRANRKVSVKGGAPWQSTQGFFPEISQEDLE